MSNYAQRVPVIIHTVIKFHNSYSQPPKFIPNFVINLCNSYRKVKSASRFIFHTVKMSLWILIPILVWILNSERLMSKMVCYSFSYEFWRLSLLYELWRYEVYELWLGLRITGGSRLATRGLSFICWCHLYYWVKGVLDGHRTIFLWSWVEIP